jgi:D-alanyl-D-alanine carboxypeptidase
MAALAWGGFANGRIPPSALKPCRRQPGHRLRADAESGLTHLIGVAENQGLRGPWLTDTYRDYDTQVRIRREKGAKVATATPGTSRHGWALAIDARPVLYQWMFRNETVARNFGWVNPAWAKQRGKSYEPWHWEWVGRRGLLVPGPVPRAPGEERKMKIETGDEGSYVAHVQRLVNGVLARSGWDGPLLGVDGRWGDRSKELYNHARMRAQNHYGIEYPEDPFEPSGVTIPMLLMYAVELRRK